MGEDLKNKFPTSRIGSERLGLCGQCSHLMACQTQYGKIYARCEEFKFVINGIDPITSCTLFFEHGQLSLYDMREMATYIVLKGHQIGFIKDETEEED